jgi:hypothetical protein
MPISRDPSLLKPGYPFIVLNDPKSFDVVDEGITWFEWGESKSTEDDHVGMIYGVEEIREQYMPGVRRMPLSYYDAKFDAGLLVVMRPKEWTPEYAARTQGWWDTHKGKPYGALSDIPRFAYDGLVWRIWPSMGRYLKAQDIPTIDTDSTTVCSQELALAIEHGFNDPWYIKKASCGAIGRGREVPGDYLTLKGFEVAQWNRQPA